MNLTTDHPLVVLILGVLLLLIGGGGGAFVIQYRRDKRVGQVDDVAILSEVRQVARDEVRHLADELARERRDRQRERRYLEARIEQLTAALRDAGFDVPPWLPMLRAVGEHEHATEE